MQHTTPAFHGDTTVKQVAIERLGKHWRAGQVTPWVKVSFADAPGIRSVMGASVESGDEAEYVRQLGIPASLARLHETLLMQCGHLVMPDTPNTPPRFEVPELAREYPLLWLQAIRVGADLRGVVPRFVAWLLHELLDPKVLLPWSLDAATEAVTLQLSVLFDAFVAGQPVASVQWAEVRRAAVKASDAAPDEAARAVSTFAESVAWPPEDSADELAGHVAALWLAITELLEKPHWSAEELARREAFTRAIDRARNDSQGTGGDWFATLSSEPGFNALMAEMESPAAMLRDAQVRQAALPARLPMACHHFEALLRLTQDT
jgi:hypothetical protein